MRMQTMVWVAGLLGVAFLFLAQPSSSQKQQLDPCATGTTLITEPLRPRMSRPEAELFNKYLDLPTTKFYFETGSGGSTYAASTKPHIEKIMVIESDDNWLDKLRTYAPVHKAECEEKRITMVHMDINANPKKWGVPLDYSHRSVWTLYAGAIHTFTNSRWMPKPDVVMIDGRFRVACAMYAFRVVHDDAYIMIHDYNRDAYKAVEVFLDKVEQAGSLAVFKVKQRTEELLAEVEELLQVYIKHVI